MREVEFQPIEKCGRCNRQTKPDEWVDFADEDRVGIQYDCPECKNRMFSYSLGIDSETGWQLNQAAQGLLRRIRGDA